MGISGEKKAQYAGDKNGAFNLNVDSLDAEGYEMDIQGLRMYVDIYILQMLKGLRKIFVLVYLLRVMKIKV